MVRRATGIEPKEDLFVSKQQQDPEQAAGGSPDNTTHQGYPSPPSDSTQSEQMGAIETEVTPVRPPVGGPTAPSNGGGDDLDDEPLADAADMITPG
jgi:hypothetical protein